MAIKIVINNVAHEVRLDDSNGYTLKNPSPAPQPESIINDEALLKNGGDGYTNNRGNESFNGYKRNNEQK